MGTSSPPILTLVIDPVLTVAIDRGKQETKSVQDQTKEQERK